jgi:hypothetical protein
MASTGTPGSTGSSLDDTGPPPTTTTMPSVDSSGGSLDDTGMLQHARYSVPRYGDGYCLDDNDRALLLMADIEDSGTDEGAAIRSLADRYLAFVSHAFDRESLRFRNFLSYGRVWMEPHGSEDSHGRAVWSLGTVVGRSATPGARSLAGDLFQAALPAVREFRSPRAWAYTLLGIDEYLSVSTGDRDIEARRDELAERLLGLYRNVGAPGWPWFEEYLTYCNARLPEALLVSGARMGNAEMIDAGVVALEWLLSVQVAGIGRGKEFITRKDGLGACKETKRLFFYAHSYSSS